MSGRDPSQAGMANLEAMVAPGDHAGGWPWLSACAGWLLGSLGAWALGFEVWKILLYGVMGAYTFAFVGTESVARLRLIVERRRSATSGESDLWDPWLDEGGAGSRAHDHGASEVVPVGALSDREFYIGGRVVLLRRRGLSLRQEWRTGRDPDRWADRFRQVDGPPPPARDPAPELGVRVLDGPDEATLAYHSDQGVVVYAANAPTSPKLLAAFLLAPWGEDELIEYLLAGSSKRCASVMARLKAADDRFLAEGNPELWRVVLDRMIHDDSIASVRQALRCECDLAARLHDEKLRQRVEDHCLSKLDVPVTSPPDAVEQDGWRSRDPALHRLIRHRAVQLLIAADRLTANLAKPDASCSFLYRRLPRDLIRETGLLIRDRPEITGRLASIVPGDDPRTHSTTASLLHAAKVGWRPAPGRAPRLSYAYLDGVDWLGIALPSAEMIRVEMDGACLWKATLDSARLDNAQLRRARLNAASLKGVCARQGRPQSFRLVVEPRFDGAHLPSGHT